MTRVGCHYNTKKNRNTQVSLHRFPNEKKVRAQWARAVGRIHLPKNPYLCSQHFSTEDYESFVRAQLMKELTGGRYPRKLKLNAVPTIFSFKAPQHHPAAVGKPGAKGLRLAKLGALDVGETTATGTVRQLTNRTTVSDIYFFI
uniref:THAP-type domain-containing protein n=1 Tax=Poecilia reticulata TaxID=8081 RepID=A0A3P9PK05_POERE